MESRDKFVDTMLRDETRRLNAHLPKGRKTVKELLGEDPPAVPTVDGGRIVMKRSELEDFGRTIPEDVRDRVRLPLVLMRRTELGVGAYVVMGEAAEEYALLGILKGFEHTFEDFRMKPNRKTLFYKPEVSELMRRFHSLLVIGFGVAGDRRD